MRGIFSIVSIGVSAVAAPAHAGWQANRKGLRPTLALGPCGDERKQWAF
jgi:hypothetical protein